MKNTNTEWKGLIFHTEYLPQFREADMDGLIGLRGYMNYFQDTATQYMYHLHCGNDTLIDKYGICWIYLKYKLHIYCKADFTDILHVESWSEKGKRAVRLYQNMIISRGQETLAYGRLEECLLNKQTQRLCRLSTIDYPLDRVVDRCLELPPFIRTTSALPENMELCYTYTVHYTDLDKSGHMNNLHYVNLMLNAFDSHFWRTHFISDFEIHYLSQCYEGEVLSVYRNVTDHSADVWGVQSDGFPAVFGVFQF